ncbi:MAG: hypothetical protein IPL46_21265 [Saprospiraceae bacterium]|nr:hypothetical protein [Saprospiraceae bacterium]
MSVLATGTGTISYEWFSNTTNSTIGGTSVGTGSSYIPSTTEVGISYYYVVASSDVCDVVTSDVAEVIVTPLTEITVQPVGSSYCKDATAMVLTVSASGTGTISYEWFSNEINSTIGGTSVGIGPTYSPSTATAGSAYYYAVASSDICDMATSEVVNIIINPLPTASISGATALCQDAASPNVTFTGANGTTPYTFTYTINDGLPLNVSTNVGESMVDVPMPTDMPGDFTYDLVSVADANECSQPQSGSVIVTVWPSATTADAGPNQEVCPSSPATLAANSPEVGTGAWSIVSGPAGSGPLGFFSPDALSPDAQFTPNHGVGVYTLLWTITDQDHNCSNNFDDVLISPIDNTPPSFDNPMVNLPVITINNDLEVCTSAKSNITLPTNQYVEDNFTTDNCGVNTVSNNFASLPALLNVGGDYKITWTVTDFGGNATKYEQAVAVEDNVAPIAVCQDITVQLDGSGLASITAIQIDNGSTDNCGIASLTIDISSFDCSDVGSNAVVLTVTDVNGNVSTCNSTVTVEDNVAPIAVCQDIAVQLDGSGLASITAIQIDNGSTDNCGIASLAIDISSFDCSDVGSSAVVLTITDVNGNVSTCNSTVTVEDNVAPIAVCQDITVQLDGSGLASITAIQIDNGSTDNCGIASLTIDISSFDCSDVGSNAVVLTVTDVNGNVSTCNSTVTVEDNVAPIAVCQDITVQLDGSGLASITAIQIDNGSTDNCGIASLAIDISSFDCSDVGSNAVVLTVTDVNGNVSTCNSTVTVEDNVAPIAVCQDITVQLDGSGLAV